MTPARFALLRASIAAILDRCSPLLVPEEQLRLELNLQLQPPATLAEFEHVLARLEAARQILRHRSPDQILQTKLTDLGHAELTL